jgi:hypothetical protein
MTNKIFKNILLIIFLANIHANAQQVSEAVANTLKAADYFSTVQNNESNFIIIESTKFDRSLSEKELKEKFDNLATINVYRQVLSDNVVDADFDKVTSHTLGKVTNDKVRKLLNKIEIAELMEAFKLKNENEIASYLNTHTNTLEYGFFFNKFRFKQLLGFVIEDKNLQKGVSYLYKITYTDKMGNEKLEGYSLALNSLQHNVVLSKIKPTIGIASVNDSLVICNWVYSLQTPEFKNFITESEKLQKNTGFFRGIRAFTMNNLIAELWVKTDKGFVPGGKQIVSASEEADSININFSVRTYPEDVVNSYVVLHDDIGNTGMPSDTTYILSVDPLQVPILRNVDVKDITDGLQLTWNKLPEKPYYKGIEITRFGENSVLDTMAILTPMDSTYSDFNVKVGVHYIYNVKALYKEGYGMEQKTPSQGVGTNTKFSKPSKITNLKATNEGQNIKLTWDYAKNGKFFGFFIYRGLSPLDMTPLAGPVKDNFYIDEAEELSGTAEYNYYVLVKDLMQQNSEPSSIVTIKPQRKVASLVPYNLKSETVNDRLYLEWVDVKTDDAFIKGYTVRRAEGDKNVFKNISTGIIEGAFFVDSTSNSTQSYQYQVASINMNGDTSEYSDAYTYMPYKEPVAVLSDYTIRNLSDGIEISWPNVLYPNRKKYNIYKSEIKSNKFQKTGSVDANERYFVDKNVEKGKEYIYTISITDIENREGEQAQVQTIIRD